ncbi:alpha-N-acetyl-neuraminyl-2,3-beta-galactosyl-1,3-N-acetyl-galactosaminide alpha-2,6-sialyltransferase-like isoform X2 [Saccoglossus kowalevskii]|uniref:Alpha-N-acetyl-neuraminyl-2,3-beta-galactosyl-1, 3-N-acetyl-galactosaminide alpha-2,6-sialyltransferase-like isoform X1 n=1 Tax=Saccoglossus kowalevskii TaxID=10224 RepID=A0ABM0GXA0_SACKO|nr:PREDICTED: alpha-N-acetyl-neuraminyl-2,3-beta-galactosyl-1,3-N-acetyl-galactosaminide alpha-2,6-sialyltransferase-like isoform X1 [Saccoglossus kowalevskii]
MVFASSGRRKWTKRKVFCPGVVSLSVAGFIWMYVLRGVGHEPLAYITHATTILPVRHEDIEKVAELRPATKRRNHVTGTGHVNVVSKQSVIQSNETLTLTLLKEDPWSYISVQRNKTLQFHCDACAIVSPSGQLLGKAAGKEIDSFPCVIRMNDHPIGDFAKDVGKKTTIRIISYVTTRLQLIRFKYGGLLKGHTKPKMVLIWGPYITRVSRIAKELQDSNRGVQFYIVNASQYHFAEQVFKSETGHNRRLHDESDHLYHYFTKHGQKECQLFNKSEKIHESHRYLTEKYVYSRWRNNYNLSFRYPSWSEV